MKKGILKKETIKGKKFQPVVLKKKLPDKLKINCNWPKLPFENQNMSIYSFTLVFNKPQLFLLKECFFIEMIEPI